LRVYTVDLASWEKIKVSKIFRRPMFRRGGNVGDGIMTGIVDREMHSLSDKEGVGGQSSSERIKEALAPFNKPAFDPVSQLLIQGGLRGFSETGGGSTFGNLAKGFIEPTEQFFKSTQDRQDAERDIALAGVEADISTELKQEEMRLTAENAELKRTALATEGDLNRKNEIDKQILINENKLDQIRAKGTTSNIQKDYSPQRAYEDLVKDRTKQSGELPFGRKPNLEQKYPRATSEYDTYILRNLRSSENNIANDIKQNNGGFVPFDPKKGELIYEEMIPGIYYFDPRRKVFVQNLPTSEENEEGGFYSVSPYTFEKNKIIPK